MDALEWHQRARSGLSECLPPLMTICLRAERMLGALSHHSCTQTQAPRLPSHLPLLKTTRPVLTFAKYGRFLSSPVCPELFLKPCLSNLLSLPACQILSLTHQRQWRSHLLSNFLVNNVSDEWIQPKKCQVLPCKLVCVSETLGFSRWGNKRANSKKFIHLWKKMQNKMSAKARRRHKCCLWVLKCHTCPRKVDLKNMFGSCWGSQWSEVGWALSRGVELTFAAGTDDILS